MKIPISKLKTACSLKVFTVILFSAFLLAGPATAHACQSRSMPSESTTLIELILESDRVNTVTADCKKCEPKSFGPISLKDKKNNLVFEIEGYIYEREIDRSFASYLNFPYKNWGSSPERCYGVPVLEENTSYTVLSKDSKLIWIGPLSPYYSSLFEAKDKSENDTRKFYEMLAYEVYKKADLYWSCDAQRERTLHLTNSEYEKTGETVFSYRYAGKSCLNGQNTNTVGFSIMEHHGFSPALIFANVDGEIKLYNWDYKTVETTSGFDAALQAYLFPQ